MAAATLPYSRTLPPPLSDRQKVNEFGSSNNPSSSSGNRYDEWGPNSVPPTSQSNIPWDDQIVPALRKKLEADSKDISKRISRIQESHAGWPRSPGSQQRRMSREVVQHHQHESSIDQFHNRFASLSGQTAALNATSSLSFHASPASISSNDATARARLKARQIAAARKQAQKINASSDSILSSSGRDSCRSAMVRHGGGAGAGGGGGDDDDNDDDDDDDGLESSIDVTPQVAGVDEYAPTAPNGVGHRSSFERRRLRTQSTPMRPSLDIVNPPPESVPRSRRTPDQSSQEPRRTANGHQRTSSLSRRRAAAAATMDPKLMEEFHPLGSTPSPTAKLLRAHQDLHPSASPSVRDRKIQPDAFRSTARRFRETSAPPSFGEASNDTNRILDALRASPGSKSVNDWEDQIIPTVARKLQQEQFLKAGKEGRFSKYEGLIDTWDRNGLPLSHRDLIAAQKASKLHEDQQRQQQQQLLEEHKPIEEEQQILTPAPAVFPQRSNSLSPIDAAFGARRSRSRASNHSRSSHRSAYSHPPQQKQSYQPYPHQQNQQHQQQQQQQQYPQPSATQATSAALSQRKNNRHQDEVDKGACCCIVM
ncbi:hypothetical protein NDA14_006129 [Ustilago hordei]|nr:hypothetical protein NDA14_006129 [Ustilago hordei]